MTVTCSNCGGSIEVDDRFCGSCGAPAPEPAAPTDATPTEVAAATPTTRPAPPPPPEVQQAAPAGATARTPLSSQTIGLLVLAGLIAVVVVVFLTQRDTPTTPSTAVVTTPTATAAPTPTATQAPTPSVSADLPGLPPGTPYTSYELITDDTGTLQVEVPAEWADRVGSRWIFHETDADVGIRVAASPDTDAFFDGWDTPGVFVGASSTLGMTPDQLLDARGFSYDCTFDGREPYDDQLYVGSFESYLDCGGTQSDFLQIAALSPDGSAILFVQIVATSDADLEAIQRIVASFQLTGPIPG